MKLHKKIILGLLIVFVLIQFIQPGKNKTDVILSTDLDSTFIIPEKVQTLLKTACYDCHSNNTNYPWYSYIQPFGWFLAGHIKKGKAELNLSEFGAYTSRRQNSKLKGMENNVRDGDMPLKSYRLLHRGARLSGDERSMLIEWLEKTRDSINRSK